ncbi:MAG: hypothetical protein M1824_003906 [Vezdaea acicularis]|nr:MAG: hypothetical protein M1824_003906 [Vezdaea acicularis]
MPAYGDTNRAFLQAILSRGTVTFSQAQPILAAILSINEEREVLAHNVTEQDFNSYIAAANDAISPFDYTIQSTLSQKDRVRVWAIVNTTSDPITQISTTHSADEISFLKRVLDGMFETFNTKRQEVMAITSVQALKYAKPPSESQRAETQGGGATQGSSSQGLTKSEAEKMLTSLVDEGWFERSRAGYYSLTPRALMELKSWLVETYNAPNDDNNEEDHEQDRTQKIKMCAACKDIVTVGQRCSKRSCPCRLHDACTVNFFRVQKSQKCPICKNDWTGEDFVGERAVTTSPAYQRGRPSGGQKRMRSINGIDDDEQD